MQIDFVTDLFEKAKEKISIPVLIHQVLHLEKIIQKNLIDL